MKKKRDLNALLVLACSWPFPALAEEFQVAVRCPAWSSEQVSQVEARIRAAVLLEETPPMAVEVVCGEQGVSVEARSAARNVERSVARTTPVLEDDIVREVDVALRELRRAVASASVSSRSAQPVPPPAAPSTTAPAPAPAPAPARNPVPAPKPAPARKPVPAPKPALPPTTAPTPSWLEIRGSGVVEHWSQHWGLGGELAPSLGDDRLRYGVALGGNWALAEAGRFEVNEAHAAVELSMRPRSSFGFGASAAAGASLLLVTPGSGLSPVSETAYGSVFLQLVVSRPLPLGALSLAPELGVRAHLAERNVLVDDVERLVLPVFVPLARLSISWSQRRERP